MIQNPTDDIYRELYQEIRKRLGNSYDYKAHEPLIRSTYDNKGNEYIWDAFKSTHCNVENEIRRRFNVKVNQNKNFDLDESLNIYKIFYRWDRYERSYEIWVEDSRELYPEIYHTWVGNREDLRYELSELEKKYNVKAARYR